MEMSKKVEAAIQNAFCVDLNQDELNDFCQALLVLSLNTVRNINGDKFAVDFVNAGMAEGVEFKVEPSKHKTH